MRALLNFAMPLLRCALAFFRSEQHLRRLLRDYVVCYNAERVHTQLRDSPAGRPTENRPSLHTQVVGLPRVAGLHHRYVWREAT